MSKRETVADFFNEHDHDHFPEEYGPWISEDHFDPKFKRSTLLAMEKSGYIELSKIDVVWCYRFLGKGTNKKKSLAANKSS